MSTSTIEVPADTPAHPWIRTSERLAFTNCPQQWEWSYVDRLKPNTPAPALRFGTLVHGALEAFYKPGIKRGPRPHITFEKLYEAELKTQRKFGFKDDDGTWNDAGELGVAMMKRYYEHWSKDEQWEVLACEFPFHYPVRNKNGRVLFTYVGVLDLVVRDRRLDFVGLVDHKTTTKDPTKITKALMLDEQSGSYWRYGVAALRAQRWLKPRQRLNGILFNFIRKAVPDPDKNYNEAGQVLNKDGTISKRQPPPFFHREPVYRDEVDGAMLDTRVRAQARRMRRMRLGVEEVYKTPGTLTNPHCSWCPFADMCELHETGQDWEEFKRLTMSTWEPYAQHEIYEDR